MAGSAAALPPYASGEGRLAQVRDCVKS
jgi:hypothetical protein